MSCRNSNNDTGTFRNSDIPSFEIWHWSLSGVKGLTMSGELNSEMLGDVLCRNSSNCQVCVVFLVVSIFFWTNCYSPSNLLVRSATCQLTPNENKICWIGCSIKYKSDSNKSDKSRNILYNCNTPTLPLAWKASSKYSQSKTITQAKSKSLVGNVISSYTGSYQSRVNCRYFTSQLVRELC